MKTNTIATVIIVAALACCSVGVVYGFTHDGDANLYDPLDLTEGDIVFDSNGGVYTDPTTGQKTTFQTFREANDSDLGDLILIVGDVKVTDKQQITLKKDVEVQQDVTFTVDFSLNVPKDITVTTDKGGVMELTTKQMTLNGTLQNKGKFVTQTAKVIGSGSIKKNPVTVLPYLNVDGSAPFSSGTGTVTHIDRQDKAAYDANSKTDAVYKVNKAPAGCNDWSDYGEVTLQSITFSSESTLVYIPSYIIGKLDVLDTTYFSYYKIVDVSDSALQAINAKTISVVRPVALEDVPWGSTVTVNPETYYTDSNGVKVYYQVDETCTQYYNGYTGYTVYTYGKDHDINYLERGHVTHTDPQGAEYGTKTSKWSTVDMICSDKWISGSFPDIIGGVVTYKVDFQCDDQGISFSQGSIRVATNATVTIDGTTLTINGISVNVLGVPEGCIYNWGIEPGAAIETDNTVIKGTVSPDKIVVDGIRYQTLEGNKAEVIPLESGYYESSNLVIPKTFKYGGETFTVVGIGAEAFSGCLNVYQYTINADLEYIGKEAFKGNQINGGITLPASLKTIGESAFDGATITAVNLKDTQVTAIGESAFNGTSLRSVETPATLGTIAKQAFANNKNLSSVKLNEGLTTIGQFAFGGLTMNTFNIPASVTTIDDDAFDGSMIGSFTVEAGSQNFAAENGVLFNAGKTELWFYPLASTADSYTVPSTVTVLKENAMRYAQNLREIVLDNGVKIGDFTFNQSGIHKVTVNASGSNTDDEYAGIVATYFSHEYWGISYNTIDQLTVGTVTGTLDLSVINGKISSSSYKKMVNVSENTDVDKVTVGAQQFKDDKGAFITKLSTDTRYTSDGTSFNFDDTRIVTVTVTPESGGSVTGETQVKIGSNATLSASPSEGYKFVKWVYGGKESTDPTLTFKMGRADVYVTAVFDITINVEITVPKGYTLTVMTITDHSTGSEQLGYPADSYMYYRMFPQDQAEVVPSGSNLIYRYALIADSNERCMFVVSDGDYECITYKHVFVKQTSKNLSFTITEDQLHPQGWTKSTIDRSCSDGALVQGDDVGGVLASINPQNYLVMQTGSQKSILMYRQWQIIPSWMSNQSLEPDFHYKLISLDGGDPSRILEITDDATLTWTLNAKSPGTVVVVAWSDAVTANFGKADRTYTASWPELSSAFVVTVSNSGKTPAFDTGLMVGDDGKLRSLDAEMDICYYNMNADGFIYRIKPADGTTVEVYNPVLGECSIIGYEKGECEKVGDRWVTHLTEGRNIVKFTNGSDVKYHVITAIPVNIEILSDSEDGTFHPGDNVTINFHNAHNADIGGIYNSKGKLFGIYNSGATIYYVDPTGARVATHQQPAFGHYYFLTEKGFQTLTLTLPETWDPETDYVLSGWGVLTTGIDGSGTHRDWFTTGGSLGIRYQALFPDIVITNMRLTVTFESEDATFDKASVEVPYGAKIHYGDGYLTVGNERVNFSVPSGHTLEWSLPEGSSITMSTKVVLYVYSSYTVTSDSVGSIVVSGSPTGKLHDGDLVVLHGASAEAEGCTYTAIPNDKTQYAFDHWLIDGKRYDGAEYFVYGDFTLQAAYTAVEIVKPTKEGDTTVVNFNDAKSVRGAYIVPDDAPATPLRAIFGDAAVYVKDMSTLAGKTITATLKDVAVRTPMTQKSYDISFTADGRAVEGDLIFTLPYHGVKAPAVYWYDYEGNLHEMKVVGYDTDSVSFSTDHNSIYVVASSSINPGKTDSAHVAAALFAVILLIAAVTGLVLRNRRPF